MHRILRRFFLSPQKNLHIEHNLRAVTQYINVKKRIQGSEDSRGQVKKSAASLQGFWALGAKASRNIPSSEITWPLLERSAHNSGEGMQLLELLQK
jgi:hypothetical protein